MTERDLPESQRTQLSPSDSTHARSSEQGRAELRAALLALHVARVDTEFNGGGDEGAIDPPVCYDRAEGPEPVVIEIPAKLAEDVRELFYDVLDLMDFDWVNNEGGFGSLAWTLADDTILVDGNERITTSEAHYYRA